MTIVFACLSITCIAGYVIAGTAPFILHKDHYKISQQVEKIVEKQKLIHKRKRRSLTNIDYRFDYEAAIVSGPAGFAMPSSIINVSCRTYMDASTYYDKCTDYQRIAGGILRICNDNNCCVCELREPLRSGS